MKLDHGAVRRGSHRAVVFLASAGLMLGLLCVTGTEVASARVATLGAPSADPPPAGHAAGSAVVSASLAGKVVGIDPGHNGLNYTDPGYLNRKIWNGREWEDCDTTGTQTASGYTEARFNWNVARHLRAILRRDGARVVLTRSNNHGVGPCVNTRSRILDRAHANVSIDIHADYGPASGRGFTILEPVADGPNDKVINASLRFGRYVHAAMLRRTTMAVADYYGHQGYIQRNDLAGLNLTTMPKVLIECGNMNNARDAALLVRRGVQRSIARALAAAIVRFLTGRP